MNYFTATIPLSLAEKLKEKGMSILIEQEWYSNGMPKAEKDCHKPMTKYCEVFDWLMEKGYRIAIHTKPANEPVLWYAYIGTMEPDYCIIADTRDCDTWHEAANAAIEKALELL